jgi:hypothetical protein
MGGILVDAARNVDLQQMAALEHRDPVRDGERLFLVVGDVDRRDAQLALQQPDLLAHLDPELGVEIGQGLVHQQQFGLDDDRAGEADALLLAAGELRRETLRERAETHAVERRGDLARDLILADAARPQPVGDVVEDRHMRKDGVVLEHHAEVATMRRLGIDRAAADAHRPGILMQEAGDDAQQRGLAAARRSEQRQELALRQRQADAIEDGQRAEPLDHALDGDVLGHGPRSLNGARGADSDP